MITELTFALIIRNNTLTTMGGSVAYFNLYFTTLPANSSVRIQNNTITPGYQYPRIIRLEGATIYNASALLEISGNVLLSSTGLTGLGTVYTIYSSYSYSLSEVSLIAASSPVMVFGNTLFGVPIDTHELTLSTVYFANSSRMLKIASTYPVATTSTTQPKPTTTTAALTTTTNVVFSFSDARFPFAASILCISVGFGTLILALTF